MDKKIKTAWVKALRSGKYRQGREYLKNLDRSTRHTKYCCLGILGCVVLGRNVDKSISPDGTEVLSKAVLKEVGLTAGDQSVLVDMNDGLEFYEGRPQSFKEIADHIAKNL